MSKLEVPVPLIQSPSKAAIGKNIAELSASGKRPHAQNVAIALNEARKSGAHIPGPKMGMPKMPGMPKMRPYRDNAKFGV